MKVRICIRDTDFDLFCYSLNEELKRSFMIHAEDKNKFVFTNKRCILKSNGWNIYLRNIFQNKYIITIVKNGRNDLYILGYINHMKKYLFITLLLVFIFINIYIIWEYSLIYMCILFILLVAIAYIYIYIYTYLLFKNLTQSILMKISH